MNKILLIKLMLVIGFMVLVTFAATLAAQDSQAESTPAVVDSSALYVDGGMI
jgi:hypothetical protein